MISFRRGGLTRINYKKPNCKHQEYCALNRIIKMQKINTFKLSNMFCCSRAQTRVFVPLTLSTTGIIEPGLFRPTPPDERWIYVTFCRGFYFRFFPTLNQLTQHCVFDLKSIKIVAFYPLIRLKHFDDEKIFHFQQF